MWKFSSTAVALFTSCSGSAVKRSIKACNFSLGSCLKVNDSLNNDKFPKLSKQQVTAFLSMDEDTVHVNHEAVQRYETCRLASNNPIEDRHSEGYCNATDGYLFGVFDGHAGVANAQAVSERLFNYIAVNLLSPNLLEKFCNKVRDSSEDLGLVKFLTTGSSYFHQEFADLYKNAVIKYANQTMSTISDWEEQFTMQRAFENAFLRLDSDFKAEAFVSDGQINSELLNVALSGACATVAHVDESHLHVANCGDCSAVLGIHNEDGSWSAKMMTALHNVENKAERRRLHKEHPNEKGTVIRDGRILGVLAPTRTFGDFKFKLSIAELQSLGKQIRSNMVLHDMGGITNSYYEPPQYYYTPPYVTALPQVNYHHLRPKDKFLVIATDGLWDVYPNPNKVVQLVADHIVGAQTIEDFQVPKDQPVQLGELHELLSVRKSNIKKRAEDKNCARHLIRNAIGQTDRGLSHGKISAMLTIPEKYVRLYRDDITVVVVYFNTDYLMSG